MSAAIRKGSTDVSLAMGLIDPTTNGPLAGATITSLDLTYCRPGAAAVTAGATVLTAVDDPHADNKVFEIDSTNAKGEYRVDWPDAAFASGVEAVTLIIADGSANQVGRLDLSLIEAVQGSGAVTYTVTIQDGGSQPIDGVEVWVTSDAAGNSIVAGTLTTDADGKAVFMLDAATYYLWKQHNGYNFTNPETITVSS